MKNEYRSPRSERIPSTENGLTYEQLVRWTYERLQLYLAKTSDEKRQALRASVEHIEHAYESTQIEGSIASLHKHIPKEHAQDWIFEALRYRDRMNEDVVAHGENWHVLADGITGYERNVCALTGELFVLIWQDAVRSIRSIKTPHPHTIRTILANTVDRTRNVLQQAFEQLPKDQQGEYADGDFSTTIEALYYHPSTRTAYLMHIGDSRTYKVDAHGRLTQLTNDHVHETRDGAKFLSSTLSPNHPSRTIDIIECQLNPNDALISCTDGTYYPLERCDQLHLLNASSAPKIIQKIPVLQEQTNYFDDASCAITKVKA